MTEPATGLATGTATAATGAATRAAGAATRAAGGLVELPADALAGVAPLRITLDATGERARSAEVPLAPLHRGVERLAARFTWPQVAVLLARVDAVGSGLRELAFARAVEQLTGTAVPERAAALREVHAQLEHLAAAAQYFAALADLAGTPPLAAACRTVRELVCDCHERWSGSRVHHDLVCCGGLRRDVDGAFCDAVAGVLDRVWDWAGVVEGRLLRTRAWERRTRGLAALTGDAALALGLSGANLRASGVAAWTSGPAPTLTHPDGDVFARVWVRLQDLRWRCRHLQETLGSLPAGPVAPADLGHAVRFPATVPAGEAVVVGDQPGGELRLLVVSAGGRSPWRLHLGAPALANAAATARLVPAAPVEEAPLVRLSLWPTWGEAAR